MKGREKKLLIVQIVSILLLLFTLIVVDISYKRIALLIITIVIYYLSNKYLIHNKKQSVQSIKVFKQMTIFALLYVALYYLIGIYIGYYQSSYFGSFKIIILYVIPIIISIYLGEKIRNTWLVSENKICNLLTLINFVLVDMIIFYQYTSFKHYQDTMDFISILLFANIINNLIYNSISKNFSYKPNTIYRLITSVFIYIMPILTDMNAFLQMLYKITIPYGFYVAIIHDYIRNEKKVISMKNEKGAYIGTSLFAIVCIIIISLISCKFRYGLMIIGSESMSGAIEKGDIILFKKQKEAEIKDIIVFEKEDITLVHRVVERKKEQNIDIYFTKGDANMQNDDGYITQEQLIGVVKTKIKYIGLPSLWIRDSFKR